MATMKALIINKTTGVVLYILLHKSEAEIKSQNLIQVIVDRLDCNAMWTCR
jgi:hypothetical protein